jgi:hypothetical protein
LNKKFQRAFPTERPFFFAFLGTSALGRTLGRTKKKRDLGGHSEGQKKRRDLGGHSGGIKKRGIGKSKK